MLNLSQVSTLFKREPFVQFWGMFDVRLMIRLHSFRREWVGACCTCKLLNAVHPIIYFVVDRTGYFRGFTHDGAEIAWTNLPESLCRQTQPRLVRPCEVHRLACCCSTILGCIRVWDQVGCWSRSNCALMSANFPAFDPSSAHHCCFATGNAH